MVDPLAASATEGLATSRPQYAIGPAPRHSPGSNLDQTVGETQSADDAMAEQLSLMWPGYLADPSSAPPMPQIGLNASAYSILLASVVEQLPTLEASLPAINVPFGFLTGSMRPLPVDLSTRQTAQPIPRRGSKWSRPLPMARGPRLGSATP